MHAPAGARLADGGNELRTDGAARCVGWAGRREKRAGSLCDRSPDFDVGPHRATACEAVIRDECRGNSQVPDSPRACAHDS
eukprot:6390071-Pyramimonas_sp.AAC.1